jgi:hypothetical protein
MRWQTTAILAVILVALGGFYYVYEVRMAPDREKAATRKDRVWTVEPADVNEIAVRRVADTVTLKRDGDRWQMLAPVQARGDRGPIEDALTTIVTAKIDREIAAQPAALAEFGLDQPVADLTLTTKDGKHLGLQLGGKNPTGVWVYARERDKPAVFVIPDSVLRDATRPAVDFRDKTILAFDRKDVSGLDLVLRDEPLGLQYADKGWQITRPRTLAADSDAVNDFLDKLQNAKVKEFVAEAPSSLQPYGLERPTRIDVHTGKDKDRATKTLLIGSGDDKKKGVYAMRAGERSVLLLPDEVWAALPKTVAAVRDKTLLAFERDKVTRVDVEGPRGAFTLVREGDRWAISRPEALPTDQLEAGALVMNLRNLRAQAFLSDDASGIARYVGRPQVKITLTEKDTAPTTILLASSTEMRGRQATAYAGVVGRGPVVLVDAKALTDLGKSATDLRDHSVVGGLDPKDVKRLQVTRDGKAVLLERQGDQEWRMLEPVRRAANAGRVDDVLFGVRGLKWKEIVAPTGEDPARFGLDKPAGEITLYRGDGTAIVTLKLGKKDGDRLYVQTKATSTIYAIEARQLELPKVPEDFQG